MKAWKRCYYVLKRTGTLKIFISFLMFLCGAAAVLTVLEPGINTLGDGLWYCFVASTTIGFGDICAVTRGVRIVTVLVAAYGNGPGSRRELLYGVSESKGEGDDFRLPGKVGDAAGAFGRGA